MPSDKLNPKKKRQWEHVYQSAKKRGASEASAHKQANSVAYKKKDFSELELLELGAKGWIDESYWVEGKRLAQDESGYQAMGGSNEKGCHNCHWYIPQDDACVIVAGDIYHTGISDYWMAVEPYEPEPLHVYVENKSFGDRVRELWFGSKTPTLELGDRQFVTFKDREGQLRFIARPTNYFRDRQKEIICEDAHKDYVEWVDANGTFPELWLWHCPGSRLGKADFVDFVDGFIVASGTIDNGKEELAKSLSADETTAMSHGFKYLQEGDTVVKYRSFELTCLPNTHAANEWSDISTIMEKDMPFSAAKREWLEARVGKELTDKYETNTVEFAERLKGLGIDWKDDAEPTPDPEPTPEPTPEPPPTAIVEALNAIREDIGLLRVAMGTQGEAIKALQQTDDAKVAQTFTPRSDTVPTGVRPSENPDNVVDGATKVKDTEWFNDIVGNSMKIAGVS